MTIPFRAPADDVKMMQRIERFIFGDNLLHDINLNFPGAMSAGLLRTSFDRATREYDPEFKCEAVASNPRIHNLRGRRFGGWVVLMMAPERRGRQAYWLCRCDCGRERVVSGGDLRRGASKSCGRCHSNISGQRFGRLTALALSLSPRRRRGYVLWLCRCDCGREKVASGTDLRTGRVKSCGRCSRPSSILDLTGMKFGRWQVIALHPERHPLGHTLWLCRCSCPKGTERVVIGDVLRRGRSTSCGCFMREKITKRNTKHGHARRGQRTSSYNRWSGMRQRCRNPNNKQYENYGARGIGIHEDYETYEGYYADRGDPPPGMSNDRINNDGDYEPKNMRWAPASVQANNRRPPRRKRRRAKLEDINAFANSLAQAAGRNGGKS